MQFNEFYEMMQCPPNGPLYLATGVLRICLQFRDKKILRFREIVPLLRIFAKFTTSELRSFYHFSNDF